MEQDCRSIVSNVITMQTTVIGNTTMTSHGTAVGFECIAGFTLQGAAVLHCENGSWDKQKPTCIVNREKSSNLWRLALSQADVIVLAACSALLLFLLVLAVLVCLLYRKRGTRHHRDRGNYVKQLQQRPTRGRHHRRRSSSVTSLTTEEELPAWNTHMPWYTARRQADHRDVHRTWAGVLPSYYPSYVTNDVPMTSSVFPMTSYYHWQPAASAGRGLSRYDNMTNTLGPFDIPRKPTSLRLSRPSRHSPLVFDPHNPVRWNSDKKAWHSFDYSQSVLPRPQLRSSPILSSDTDSLPGVTEKSRSGRSHIAEGSV